MQRERMGWILIISMIGVAVLSRFLPHWHNFTAVGAMGLFGGAYLNRRLVAIAIPLVALWISDLLLNNLVYGHYYDGFVWIGHGALWVYAGFIGIVLIGILLLKKVRFGRLIVAAVVASLLFFIVTNFGSWLTSLVPIYPKTPAGLLSAYEAGLPFFWNTLLANLCYSLLFFGVYEWFAKRNAWSTTMVG